MSQMILSVFLVCLLSLWRADDVITVLIWPLTPLRCVFELFWVRPCDRSQASPWQQVLWLIRRGFVNGFGQQRTVGKKVVAAFTCLTCFYFERMIWIQTQPSVLQMDVKSMYEHQNKLNDRIKVVVESFFIKLHQCFVVIVGSSFSVLCNMICSWTFCTETLWYMTPKHSPSLAQSSGNTDVGYLFTFRPISQ